MTIDRANQVWAADITSPDPRSRARLRLDLVAVSAENTGRHALLHRRTRGGAGALRHAGDSTPTRARVTSTAFTGRLAAAASKSRWTGVPVEQCGGTGPVGLCARTAELDASPVRTRGADGQRRIDHSDHDGELNDVDPRAWLADVLARLTDHPALRLPTSCPGIGNPDRPGSRGVIRERAVRDRQSRPG